MRLENFDFRQNEFLDPNERQKTKKKVHQINTKTVWTIVKISHGRRLYRAIR